jgi:hypothetical protein
LERRINQRTVSKATPNLEALRPNFGWLPIERIKKTIQATTSETGITCIGILFFHLISWQNFLTQFNIFCHNYMAKLR